MSLETMYACCNPGCKVVLKRRRVGNSISWMLLRPPIVAIKWTDITIGHGYCKYFITINAQSVGWKCGTRERNGDGPTNTLSPDPCSSRKRRHHPLVKLSGERDKSSTVGKNPTVTVKWRLLTTICEGPRGRSLSRSTWSVYLKLRGKWWAWRTRSQNRANQALV